MSQVSQVSQSGMTPRESVYRSDEEDPENIQKLSSGYSVNEEGKDEAQDTVSVNSKRKKVA